MQPDLCIENQSTSTEIPKDEDPPLWVSACLALTPVLAALNKRMPTFSIVYLDAPEAASINQEFSGKSYATNVLSFPADIPDFIMTADDGFTLGDLVICPAIVAREALEQNKPFDHHFAHMTIHGFLHLLGFDHISDEQAQIMESLEIAALHRLSIPNPYITPDFSEKFHLVSDKAHSIVKSELTATTTEAT